MFYADFVLSKKGPLSKVWLAAHWEKKLTKVQIFETNVDEAVNEIMRPQQKLALRTTGHLLLGICRVYSRKTKYLLADTNEAFLKIKLAFRNGALDEPNPVVKNFTIQDIYGEFGDNNLPEFDEEDLNHAPICQSRIDDITLKEDIPQKFDYLGGGSLDDDDFGEIAAGVGPEDYQRMLDDCNKYEMEMELELARNATNNTNSFAGREREATPFLTEAHAPGNAIFGDDDFSSGHHNDDDDHNHQSSSMEHHNGAMDDMVMDYEDNHNHHVGGMTPLRGVTPMRAETPMSARPPSPAMSIAPSMTMEQDTVENFYQRQAERRQQQKELSMKKRRTDEVKMITGDEMKANMADYSDTLSRLDLAPPTARLTHFKKASMAEYLHHNPGMIGFSRSKLFIRKYQSFLTVTKKENPEVLNEAIKEALGLRDIGEDEMQLQQQEMDLHGPQDDPAFIDDFEEVAPIDLEQLEMMDHPQEIEDYPDDDIIQPNPLSPYAPMVDDEDNMSPSDKRRKDEKDEPETDDDNRWSKRTHALLQTISTKLNNSDNGAIEIDELMKKNTSRKIAASKFYSLLCLKKNQCVDVTQKEPYGEIKIQAGPNINVNMI